MGVISSNISYRLIWNFNKILVDIWLDCVPIFIIEAEIGKKLADSEKSGFSTEKKLGNRWNLRIFQNAFNTSLE